MNFFDKLGRLHTKPVTESDPYPTNNAYIYTAYAKVLYPRSAYFSITNDVLKLPNSVPFSRHPDQISPPISHDEVTGVCILSKPTAEIICEYLKSNYNQFCDIPGFVPKSLLRLNWLKVIAAFNKLRKEEKPRRATINYPEVHNVAFLQRPEYMWFYKRCAGITPSLFEKCYFLAARMISVLKWKKEDPNLLLYFSLLHLKQQDNLGIEGQIVRCYMNSIVDDMYNTTGHMLSYATKDLPRQYYFEHPWVKG